MSDPSPKDALTLVRELTLFGRALTGSIRAETVAEATIACLDRLFAPAACAVAFTAAGAPDAPAVAASRGPAEAGPDPAYLAKVAAGHDVVGDRDPPRIGAPIIAAGHTMGVVTVTGKRGVTFDAAAEALLAAVAAQAAVALQNSRLFDILSTGKIEWEQLVDAIKPAIAIIDADGRIRRANRAFAELVGAPVTALPARPWLTLLPPSWADVVGRTLANPASGIGEIRADQRIFSVRAHAAGEQGTMVLLIEDMTDTRRLQEQLVQSEKLSAIGQLIAGVAHELNNPLASVLGFADFLAESDQTPPGLAEPVRVIQQEAQRAAGIVRNLLTFARRQDQERQSMEVGPILKRTLALLNNQLMGMKVEPRLWLDPDLPPVHGSPNQLQQVFLNLVNNAAQALAAAGGGAVTVRARRWLGGVAVDVQDDGPGISEELRERVFEPFFTTKGPGEGTGLGLSICQGIVKEHGGRITLTSMQGQGTTFTVELPGAAPAEAASAPEPEAPAARGRVLVVDDEPHILYYMRATLEAWGHAVETAGDGLDGLERALAGGHDVIITDVRMPRLGGREFFERLRAERPAAAARVVFATGDTVRDDTMAFIERSGRPFLNKPFKLAELRAMLGTVLGG